MSTYLDNIKNYKCECLDDILDCCHQSLPQSYKSRPWTHPELNHGVDLLSSDEALNCYMSAYGDMHKNKCRAAMMNFPFNDLNGSIEIVDWGCGQGIGSITILDILKQRELLKWVKRITLIEPSQKALERAKANLSLLTQNCVEIIDYNKYMPANGSKSDDCISSIGYNYSNIIHVFSNILDVKAIDLSAVARMVASSQGKHFILCIGPKNSAAYRIEQFCSIFGEQDYFSNIDSVRYGQTRRTAHPFTCMTRCFKYNGGSLDYSHLSYYQEPVDEVFDEYDWRLQIQNKVLSPQKANVAYRLRNILFIDDIMYVSPVVNEAAVDFIIVRPNRGILLVNVFDENLHLCSLSDDKKKIIIRKDNNTSQKEFIYQSPIELINYCQNSIKEGIEELLMRTIENSKNFSLIKKVVVFTENKLEEVKEFFNVNKSNINYISLFGNEFINDSNISNNLYNTIGFKYYNKAFDDVVKRKIAKIISPTWHSYQEGKNGLEPKGAQKGLSRSRNIQQKISGVAGAGKTLVLANRAINAIKRTGGDVLILTFNITLANYLRLRLTEIREDFSWEKIDVFPYHQFFRIRAAECSLHVNCGSYEDVNFFNGENIHKKYSAIFVDEVQDYTTEWLRIVMQNFLIDPNGEIVVFGDPKQNVYHRPLDTNNDIRLGVIGGQWNKQLVTGRRFSNPRLAILATSFQSQFLPNLPTDVINTENAIENTLNFQIMTYVDMRESNSFDDIVDKIIEIIYNDDRPVQDFVLLASTIRLLRNIDFHYRNITNQQTEVTFIKTEVLENLKSIHHVTDENTANWKYNRDFEALERTRKQLFTTDKRCLKISTIQSFKGWEAPSVIVLLEEDYLISGTSFSPTAPETIYTAITRARESLYVINIGNNKYDNFFKNQI